MASCALFVEKTFLFSRDLCSGVLFVAFMCKVHPVCFMLSTVLFCRAV